MDNTPSQTTTAESRPEKQPWEEPRIILERTLEAQAQSPEEELPPLFGPLAVSGGTCP